MRTRRALFAACAVCLLALVACADKTTHTARHTAHRTAANAAANATVNSSALRTSIAELVTMPGGPPGAAVIVQRGTSRTFYPGGVGILGGRAPQLGDHMRVASVAKAFSGATALVLVNKGVLRLQDTIGRWLPTLPTAWHGVTLQQLLEHTSGLPDYSDSSAFVTALQKSPTKAPPPSTLLTFAAPRLDFPAGTQYHYSNSDNIAVALIIRAATGKPYETVLAKDVLQPLGLSQTSLPSGTHLATPAIHGYALEGATGKPTDDVTGDLAAGWAWASGGVVSTPADLNAFIRGYVSGRLISPGLRAQWQRLFLPAGGSEPPGPGFNSAAMALFRYQTPCGTVYGHSGNTLGFTQYAVASKDGSRSATISINEQVTQNSKGQLAKVFAGLQQVAQAAICQALR